MAKNYLDEFYVSDVEPLLQELIDELEAQFQSEHCLLKNKCIIMVQELFRSCQKLLESKKQSVSFVMFHLLRFRMLNHDYRYQVNVYPREWYLKEGITIGDLDVSFAYHHFDCLWNQLLVKSRRFMGKLNEVAVERIMLRVLEPFHAYVVELLRYSLMDLLETEEFKTFNRKDDLFYIRAGEFYEPGDVIYIENKEKDIFKIQRWLQQSEKQAYCFSDFQGLDFAGQKLKNLDLRYVDFRNCKLENTDFSLSVLQGTKFRDANLRNSKFHISYIGGTDFTRADLSGTQFAQCIGYIGKKPMNEWKLVGFTETVFSGCNLENASFRGAVIQGADFTGAVIRKTDFQGTNLFQSRFSKDAVSECNFTKEQLEQILIV